MKRQSYLILMASYMLMGGISGRSMEELIDGIKAEYLTVGGSKKISNKKVRDSFSSGKTFYQNPNLNRQFYYNKTFPGCSKNSYTSLRGKEIRANNKIKNLENKVKK